MPKEVKVVDPLPEEFASEEAAGEFWDSHSLADYPEHLEPVDVEVDVERRHFQIEIDEQSQILDRGLATKPT